MQRDATCQGAPDATERAIVLLADPLPPPAHRAELARLVAEPACLDWRAVLDRARENGVHAAAGQRLVVLARAGAPVPPDVVAEARDLRDRAVFRELEQRRLLARLLDAWAEASLPPPLLLKGAALRETVYPAPWLRAMDDVDLLVSPDQVGAATAALGTLGFAARAVDPRRAVTEAGWHSRTFVAPGAPLRVDLHTALARPGRFSVEPYASLAWRERRFSIEGRAAAGLPDGDVLLGLALHAAEMSGRGALKRLVDMALLVRHGRFVWSWVVRRARRWRAVGAFRAALWLCARATGAVPPPWVWGRLHDGSLRARAVRRLIAPPGTAAFAHEPPDRLRSLALLYWVPDGSRERVSFAARYLGLRLRDALAAAHGADDEAEP